MFLDSGAACGDPVLTGDLKGEFSITCELCAKCQDRESDWASLMSTEPLEIK